MMDRGNVWDLKQNTIQRKYNRSNFGFTLPTLTNIVNEQMVRYST